MRQAIQASTLETTSIQEAAAEIVALINSIPRSPWPSEIEAIVARAVSLPDTAMSGAHAAHYQQWRRLVLDHGRLYRNPDETGKTDAEIDAEEDRMAAHMTVVDTLGKRILAVPARTWGDVMLYAQVCSWEYWAGSDMEGPDAREWLEIGPQSDHADSDALAKLLEAIFAVAGVGHFRQGGR